MTRTSYTHQRGVAAFEAAGIITLVLAVAFLLFDLSQAIRVHNRAGAAAAMLADVISTTDPAATPAEISSNMAQLEVIARDLDSNPKKMRVTVYEDPFSKQVYGSALAPCTTSGNVDAIFTGMPRPLPADYKFYVVEVCYEDPADKRAPSVIGSIVSPSSQILPAYGISHAAGR